VVAVSPEEVAQRLEAVVYATWEHHPNVALAATSVRQIMDWLISGDPPRIRQVR
jgi:hypothetical protein